MTFAVFDAAAIERATTSRLVLDTIRDALIAHAEGRAHVPPPLHLDFPEVDGDCHVKAGWITGAADFTVKIATGFYGNPARGLSANHGLVCVVSARTGAPRALLDDRGLLTVWRTAAAGALITHAMARPAAGTLAVFGTGEQARLQAARSAPGPPPRTATSRPARCSRRPSTGRTPRSRSPTSPVSERSTRRSPRPFSAGSGSERPGAGTLATPRHGSGRP
ncbi:hypothetical protein [Streptomyces platensis]